MLRLRYLLPLAAALLLLPVATADAGNPHDADVDVLQREQLGGYIEDTTYIPRGPWAGHIVMTMKDKVFGVPASAGSDGAVKLLFDSSSLGWGSPPKGIAYIESEQAFAFVDAARPEILFLADADGKPLPSRPITYLPEPLDRLHSEGLTYMPRDAAHFPDHLLMLANRWPTQPPFQKATIEILRRDGTVVDQIVPRGGLKERYLSAITTVGDDRILIGVDNEVWTLDFGGNVVRDPVTVPGTFVEGLEVLPDGRIVMSDADRLYFFDQDLNRLPEGDRDAGIGVGLLPRSVAWNSDTGEHILAAAPESSGDYFQPYAVTALDPRLRSTRQLFSFAPADAFRQVYGLEYLPAEHLTAALLWRTSLAVPGQIALFDRAGTEVRRIDLPDVDGASSPGQMTWVPQTQEFAVIPRGGPQRVQFVSSAGAFVRQFDLAAHGVHSITALTAFDTPAGTRLLILTSGRLDGSRALITDLNGTVLREVGFAPMLGAFGATDLATITTGRDAPAFSLVVGWPKFEIVVFRLNAP